MSVAECKQKVSSAEFIKWMAFWRNRKEEQDRQAAMNRR